MLNARRWRERESYYDIVFAVTFEAKTETERTEPGVWEGALKTYEEHVVQQETLADIIHLESRLKSFANARFGGAKTFANDFDIGTAESLAQFSG